MSFRRDYLLRIASPFPYAGVTMSATLYDPSIQAVFGPAKTAWMQIPIAVDKTYVNVVEN